MDDPATVCQCASQFYGQCLRQAGCESSPSVGAFTVHTVYMRDCTALM